MRTIFASFALLATVNAAGGGAEIPKEKVAPVATLTFKDASTTNTEVKVEYLQKLSDGKASLVAATVISSKTDNLYKTRFTVNLRKKGETDCLVRYTVEGSGITAENVETQKTYTVAKGINAEGKKACSSDEELKNLLTPAFDSGDFNQDAATLAAFKAGDGVRSTSFTSKIALFNWERTLAGTPELKQDDQNTEISIAWNNDGAADSYVSPW